MLTIIYGISHSNVILPRFSNMTVHAKEWELLSRLRHAHRVSGCLTWFHKSGGECFFFPGKNADVLWRRRDEC